MTQQFQQDRELGWDDTIVQDSEFILLEPGEYWFTVENLNEHAIHQIQIRKVKIHFHLAIRQF